MADFPVDVAGLDQAGPHEVVAVPDGRAMRLCIAPVAKRIGDATVRMLAYNGSIPGPTLRVAEGSEILVEVENQGDLETTVHWHGLRLDNRYDGTHATQTPIRVGDTFEYRLEFPDPGAYWYHPHVRQDYGQEMGLYGSIVVEPADSDYWPPAHRELALTLDDILIEHGQVATFSREETTHAAMGRFGNTMLVNGERAFELEAGEGEVVRLHLTNTANTRVFNVAVRGGRMKLVGGDSGRVEHEQFVDSVLLGPSERAVVDVLFDAAGMAALEHRTPQRTYELATIAVGEPVEDSGPAAAFDILRTNPELVAERERLAPHRDREPDRILAFVAEMDFTPPEGEDVAYTCAMHPEIVSAEQGNCPLCGMKLMPVTSVPALEHHGHHEHSAGGHADGPAPIEWEDDMVEMNRGTTPDNMRWKLVDRATGLENLAIDWKFQVGEQVKIRLVNEIDSDHPMHHPFHIHGAGRFLVLSRDGEEDPNLVWTDTVLVMTGEVVDILVDVTHPGSWLAHCHIAEHHESGMVLGFEVSS